jgi:hypothetical protein
MCACYVPRGGAAFGGAMMQVATESEVRKWITDVEWHDGIKADGTTLYYAESEANGIQLTFPETPLRATYMARVASMLGIDDESQFHGALLWITLSTIGSIGLEKAGWKLVEKMRQGYGENRPLQSANGHFFRSDELVDLNAFLIPCFVFGWDAYVVPSSSNDFFVFLSHDEYWGVVTRTRAAYDDLFHRLKDLNPRESPHMRKRFCRPANP